MKANKSNIVVFEHEKLRIGDVNNCRFDEAKLTALQKYYGTNGVPYYSLIHKGVQFNSFVGVIQIGNLIIEVLPKADKANNTKNEQFWRDLLIEMIRSVNNFDIQSTSHSHLKLRPNSILDLYIEMFICEIEYLIHSGLIKQYRKKEGNQSALKGSLNFSRNLQENLVHQERFYVRHSVYDPVHLLHILLYQAILLIKEINTNVSLISRINAILLNYPEMPNAKITEQSFGKIIYNRKNERYRKAVEIAKLLLLKFHPDLKLANNFVLALMFDMNLLWEQFIFVSLKKQLRKSNSQISIHNQVSRNFWQHEFGRITKIRPDIILKINQQTHIVLDTKWKNLNGKTPSTDDLRQMYVYHEYFEAPKVALIYPDSETFPSKSVNGKFHLINPSTIEIQKECSIIPIKIEKQFVDWQKSIEKIIFDWINL